MQQRPFEEVIVEVVSNAGRYDLPVLATLLRKVVIPSVQLCDAICVAWNAKQVSMNLTGDYLGVLAAMERRKEAFFQAAQQQGGMAPFDHPHKRVMVSHDDMEKA